MCPKTRYTNQSRCDQSSIPASFPSHGSKNFPPGLPRISSREGPRQQTHKHHLQPLATHLEHLSKSPLRLSVDLGIRPLPRVTAPSPRKQGYAVTLIHSHPCQFSSPAPILSGLSPPTPRPHSLTRSPPPMMVQTVPPKADLEDSGRIGRKRREIAQL